MWSADDQPPEQTDTVLKAHLKNGDVYVFDHWQFHNQTRRIGGMGFHYDMNRTLKEKGMLSVSIDDVALFESNKPVKSPFIAALALITAGSIAMTVVCLTNPKTCFGSCPTFYVPGANGPILAAEAFSDAVAPSLAKRDLDALFHAQLKSSDLVMRVTNEALETHVIDRTNLLAATRPHGGRVLATSDGRLLKAVAFEEPQQCRADEGDCRDTMGKSDGSERWSLTEATDLATKETIDLEFAPSPDDSMPYGFLVEARQTFVTTFLMYQALAYLGSRTGPMLAALSSTTNGPPEALAGIGKLFEMLGGIELLVEDGRGGWQPVGRFNETGPIASDVQLIEVPKGLSARRLRLRITKGYYRIDRIARVRIAGPATVTQVPLAAIVTKHGDAAGAQAWLAGKAPQLVTQPGDDHALHFRLPDNYGDLDLFLDSHGYYIEWMRSEWLKEENFPRFLQMVSFPSQALRNLAPAFKRVEPGFEDAFWKSRYVKTP